MLKRFCCKDAFRFFFVCRFVFWLSVLTLCLLFPKISFVVDRNVSFDVYWDVVLVGESARRAT